MTKLTSRQVKVMDHAVASRNHFFATPGSPNDGTWKELVSLGFAVAHENKTLDGYIVYCVTKAGTAALIKHHIEDL